MGSASPPFPFHPRPIDTPLPLKIGIIGAGISGIGLYIRLRQYIPSASIAIWEKNPDVGGTWFENRYPGVKCDIPSHVYQYTFEPNTQWSEFFSGGEEIEEYVRGVCGKYGVKERVRFERRVVGARWMGEEGKWSVDVEGVGKGESEREKESVEVDVLINATGCLNNWKLPEIEGLDGFEGKVMHSACWDRSWNYEGLIVALIGIGSSGIQILPHLQRECKDVRLFARGGTWISEPFGGSATQETISGDKDSGNYKYTEEELRRFREDPAFYKKYRKYIERFINLDHPCLTPGTKAMLEGKEKIVENMKMKLAKKKGLYEMLEPSWSPGCRRLTPGPGFLEALVEENVHFSKSNIVRVTKDTIITANGKETKVDAIICATGFDTSYLPRFPITGLDNILLSSQWSSPNHASAYLSLATPNFPNFFMVGGPNSATGGGSLLIIFESIIGYVVKAVQKLAREHIKSMTVKESSLKTWEEYMDQYFETTVHVESCTSWYKAGKNGRRVVGLWPGSSLHARKALEFPRWEDWVFEFAEGEGSSGLGWLGDGWTVADREGGDVSAYLDEVDYPPVPA